MVVTWWIVDFLRSEYPHSVLVMRIMVELVLYTLFSYWDIIYIDIFFMLRENWFTQRRNSRPFDLVKSNMHLIYNDTGGWEQNNRAIYKK